MDALKIINRGKKFVLSGDYRFLLLSEMGFYKNLNDEEYLRRRFKAIMGQELDLEKPQTYNEKIQWLKLHDRNPMYTILVDKIKVKDWVASVIGEEYIIPTLNVYDKPEEIDFDKLPNQFVLKCNHNSGTGMYICKDKSNIDKKKIKKDLKKGLAEDKYHFGREWAYKNVNHRILAEKYMEDSKNNDLRDYKFFCFNGEVKALFIATGRQRLDDETRFDFYDQDFKHLDFTNGHPNADCIIEKPLNFELMKKLAAQLSKGIPHVRVDLYEVDGKVYFGEMTFYHWSGLKAFVPETWDYIFGKWIELPQ